MGWLRWVFWWSRGTYQRRLEAEIPSFKLRLVRARETGELGKWVQSAQAAVDAASLALRLGHVGEALIAFDRAQREEISSLTEKEIHLRAICLMHQSVRMSGPARDTIKQILQKETAPSAEELSAATQVRDEDLHRAFFEIDRLSRHLKNLSYITLGVLVGVVVLAALHVVFPGPSIVLGVMCFGALGAALSMMISIAPPTTGSIQRQLASGVLLFARPLFGASAAVAVYVLVRMGVLNPTQRTAAIYAGHSRFCLHCWTDSTTEPPRRSCLPKNVVRGWSGSSGIGCYQHGSGSWQSPQIPLNMPGALRQ